MLWDLSSQSIKFKEHATVHWEDPGLNNKKQSLLDLSSKSKDPLRNNGPWEGWSANCPHDEGPGIPLGIPSAASEGCSIDTDPRPALNQQFPTAHGQGGPPSSGQRDIEALDKRLGRQETCIVNAAIMASSWSHKPTGGRKYNKAIVVDLDLPSWNTESSESSIKGS